jgi:hypothetical protein
MEDILPIVVSSLEAAGQTRAVQHDAIQTHSTKALTRRRSGAGHEEADGMSSNQAFP